MGKPLVTQPQPDHSKEKVSNLPESCTGKGCKTKAHRFGFCSEHFEQYKFGLISKDGKKVSDYEKKIDHYQAFLAKEKLKKVA